MKAMPIATRTFPYGPFRVEVWKHRTTANLLFLLLMAALFGGIAAWGSFVLHELDKAEQLLDVGAVVNAFGVPYLLWLATPVKEFRVGDEGIEVRFDGPVRKKTQFVPWRLISLAGQPAPTSAWKGSGAAPSEPVAANLVMMFRDPGLPIPRLVATPVPPPARELVERLSQPQDSGGMRSQFAARDSIRRVQ